MRTRWSKKRNTPKNPIHPNQAESFELCAVDFARKYPDCFVEIGHRDKSRGMYKHVAKWTLADAISIANDNAVEETLRDENGGGYYEAVFKNNGVQIAQYTYAIAGTPKKSSSDSDGKEGGTGQGKGGFNNVLMEKLLDKAFDRPQDAFVEKLVDAALKPRDNGEGGFQKELFGVLVNNTLDRKDNMLKDYIEAHQMLEQMRPRVESPDMVTALINAAGTIGGQIAAAKFGGAQPRLPQAGGTVQGSSPPGMTPMPKPGAAEEGALAGTQPAAGTSDTAAAGDSDTESAFGPMLDRFRKRIAQGASADEISSLILALVTMAASDPPPTLKGLVEAADPLQMSNEFDRFCAAIPELRRNPDLQAAVKASLAQKVLGPEAGATEDDTGQDYGAEENHQTEPADAGAPGEFEPSGSEQDIDDGGEISRADELAGAELPIE